MGGRKIDAGRDAKILDLNRLGLHLSEIAGEVGFTKEGVRCALIRLGEKRSHQPGSIINSDLVELLRRKTLPGPNGCVEWQGGKTKGYGSIRIGYEHWFAHRVAFHLYVGPIPADLHVLHACDNPSCVNPEHLFLGTHQDNMDDMCRKGRDYQGVPKRGSMAARAKLTAEQVEEIRRLYQMGVSHYASTGNVAELAKRFCVSKSTIHNVAKRVTYANQFGSGKCSED